MYEIGEKEILAVAQCIRSGTLFRFLDPENGEVFRFEKAWASKIATKYALGVNSGTSALICGLVGLGIGPGDEVIIPAYTFVSSALAVLAVGAIPKLAEVDRSLTIDPSDIRRKITPRTKAIMPVHMNGFPADMGAITAIAKEHSLRVIEDCCQADGGSYKGKRLGSIGDVGAFSFNYYKIISCGDGGALVTSDDEIYQRAVIHHDSGCAFRAHAKDLKVELFAGQNYRMLEIMGAILNVQVARLEPILSTLRRTKMRILRHLDNLSERFISSNDLDGDCGTTIGFSFDSEQQTRRFISLLAESSVHASTPIDSGRHIYSNWEVVMNKRGAHHPSMNPFKMQANRGSRVKYASDMCPQTLDILRTTAFISVSPSWTARDAQRIASACKRVYKSLG